MVLRYPLLGLNTAEHIQLLSSFCCRLFSACFINCVVETVCWDSFDFVRSPWRQKQIQCSKQYRHSPLVWRNCRSMWICERFSLFQKIQRNIDIGKRISDSEAVRYRCFQCLQTGKYSVQSADFYPLPEHPAQSVRSTGTFSNLFVDVIGETANLRPERGQTAACTAR